MTEYSERPLVTFALFAYNQEKYIRDAVEGAFAQTYSPLEIILSDDCSSDHTFQIIKEIANNYQGIHKIILNRNPKNLRLAGHINHVMSLVSSRFVVIAAGDDVSLPNRTDELVCAWLAGQGLIKSVHSFADDMNEAGRLTGQIRQGSPDSELSSISSHSRGNIGVLGSTHGWDMEVFDRFGPLMESVINEDVVIPARAALIGRVELVPKSLVRYRIGIGVSHLMSQNRKANIYVPPLSELKRPYYHLLQKFRDYRVIGVHQTHYELFRHSRAEALFPVWLRRGRRPTKMKVAFFMSRCRPRYLIKEFVKGRFPNLVILKQKMQFFILDLVTRKDLKE